MPQPSPSLRELEAAKETYGGRTRASRPCESSPWSAFKCRGCRTGPRHLPHPLTPLLQSVVLSAETGAETPGASAVPLQAQVNRHCHKPRFLYGGGAVEAEPECPARTLLNTIPRLTCSSPGGRGSWMSLTRM